MGRLIAILRKALLIIPIIINAIKRIVGIVNVEKCKCGKGGRYLCKG